MKVWLIFVFLATHTQFVLSQPCYKHGRHSRVRRCGESFVAKEIADGIARGIKEFAPIAADAIRNQANLEETTYIRPGPWQGNYNQPYPQVPGVQPYPPTWYQPGIQPNSPPSYVQIPQPYGQVNCPGFPSQVINLPDGQVNYPGYPSQVINMPDGQVNGPPPQSG